MKPEKSHFRYSAFGYPGRTARELLVRIFKIWFRITDDGLVAIAKAIREDPDRAEEMVRNLRKELWSMGEKIP